MKTNDGTNENILKRKRKKRHQVDEEEWESKKAKISREHGKEYKGRKVVNGKVTCFVNRPERKVGPMACKCSGKTFQCKTLKETDRQQIITDFWNLTWKERKMYIKSMPDVSLTQRTRDRKHESKSRRKC